MSKLDSILVLGYIYMCMAFLKWWNLLLELLIKIVYCSIIALTYFILYINWAMPFLFFQLILLHFYCIRITLIFYVYYIYIFWFLIFIISLVAKISRSLRSTKAEIWWIMAKKDIILGGILPSSLTAERLPGSQLKLFQKLFF